MKKFKENLTSIFRTHFNNKIFFSYIVLLVIPLSLFLLFCYSQSSRIATQQGKYTAQKVLAQTSSYLEDKITSYKNIINVVSYDRSIQTVLATGEQFSRESEGNWIIPSQSTGNIIYTMNSSNDISNIHLYSLEGRNSFENSAEFKKLTPDEQNAWKKKFSNIDDIHYLWIPPSFFSSSEKLGRTTIFKKIPSSSKLFTYVGMISATLSDQVFHDILAQAATTPNSSVALFNSDYDLIDSYGNTNFFSSEHLNELLPLYDSQSDSAIQIVKYQGVSYLMGYTSLDNSDWCLLMLFPHSDILAANRIYLEQMIVMVFLLILASVPILYFTSRFLTTRIGKLNKHIDDAMKNNYKSIPLYNGKDEVGQLTTNFNNMLIKINELLAEQYRSGYLLKDLELQVLQSQINPHFLYNTLDMIYWLSCDNEDKRVSQIAKDLGSFYKLSLGHGQSIVTIGAEIEHAKVYTAIQNIRFDNKIQLVVTVPEELMKYSIIKLILQPLVENAILHGIREKYDESGTITISGKLLPNSIILSVTDDGVGMSDEDIHVLLSPPTATTGYALWNIEERLKLTYGPDYGLNFSSECGTGTTVTILLPVTDSSW